MKTIAQFLLAGALILPVCYGQLSKEQKTSDFQQLVAVYAKNYKPYEWKIQAFGYDLLKIKPWMDMIEASKDDLEFYDICVKYVAALQDSHDEYILPSDFEAWLPINVDIYDGKVLIEGVDFFTLPPSEFPIRLGDEVVSVDGKSAEDWIQELTPYSANGMANESSRRRLAALTMIDRHQGFYPYAPNVGDTAEVAIRSSDGTVTTYTLPWSKYGTPLLSVGPVPGPSLSSANRMASLRASLETRRERARAFQAAARQPERIDEDIPVPEKGWDVYDGPAEPRVEQAVPAYLKPLRELESDEPVGPKAAYANFGSRSPVFAVPTGFVQRLGRSSADQFVSGTFPSGDYKVGFIRIWTMSPSNQTLALQQFQSEIQYFNQNTDGLVIDVMHNGGGSLCYIETLMRSLIPQPFRGVAYEIRATELWTQVFSSSLYSAKLSGAEKWVVDLYTVYLEQVQQARKEMRGSTGNLPICGPTFEDIAPFPTAYTKPILVLTNELSLSAAEAFTGLLQDAGRIVVFGTRTDGGGGNPGSYAVGAYSMGTTRATRTLVTRKAPVSTPGYPAANHMENVGVYPDIWQDFMTKDNLMQGGRPFSNAFVAAVADLIKKSKP